MSASRSESQSQYGRRRSNTAQSILRYTPQPTSPPLKLGDTKVLNAWVHDSKENAGVQFNQGYWPGVAEGDLLRVSSGADNADKDGFLFIVSKEEVPSKPQLQISIPKSIADTFDIKNHGEVMAEKVDKDSYSADYIEMIFQDQYLGRNDMWRMGEYLVKKCVYVDQDVSFIGSIVATVKNVYIGGKKARAAYVTSRTKAIYRSLSAKVTIFIQVCRELWEFAGDGERYNEKIVHSFLPALFAKWREAGTNHTVTIVLISRVYYDETEIEYAAGPLRQDERGEWYKDFYKVITDLEVVYEWKPTLVSLKNSFWDFQRDILLTHHYHRASLDPSVAGPADQVRLVGRLSYAHDGPILEALNLGLNPTETHYIDRSLTLTGVATLLITPGTGYFRVSKKLLRLTTTRMLDQGFLLDLICLTKHPLHQSPVFSFESLEPKLDKEMMFDSRAMDPLWGGDEDNTGGGRKITCWWEPFWTSVSFWDRQMDLPFREDRFVARAKMHEIQMLGLLEHDVLSSIEVPFLHEQLDSSSPIRENFQEAAPPSQMEADQFDLNIFTLQTPKVTTSRNSVSSITSGPATVPARASIDKRSSRNRDSLMTSKIQRIEESPQAFVRDLPSDGLSDSIIGTTTLSTSPSQSSIRSVHSHRSSSSKTPNREPHAHDTSSRTLGSKLTPSWLFKPFRSGPSEPQTSNISASGSQTRSPGMGSATTALTLPSSSPTPSPTESPAKLPSHAQVSRSPAPLPLPMLIKSPQGGRSALSRALEDDTFNNTLKGPGIRRSPVNTPPREDPTFGKRRSTLTQMGFMSASPSTLANPSQSGPTVSHTQSSLAARWQHLFPRPLYKHEIKWKSLVTPGCLPLTVEYFPSTSELETNYDVFSYDFVVDPKEMRSFLVKPPNAKGNADLQRQEWASVVMKGMAAVRLAQGFQFVIRPSDVEGDQPDSQQRQEFRRTKSFMAEHETPKPVGASDILRSKPTPVYLSMSNEIHRIAYTGETIQVRRYVRRMPPAKPFEYQCLIWPKLGVGYTEQKTTFTSHGLENYGWNRLDMLVAGYEQHFNESLRYWRTRFVVIPTADPPSLNVGPSGEKLNDEETRILGIEKLAEQFTKVRWQPPEEKSTTPPPPVRFLPTTLNPASSVLDETLMEQLDQIHTVGPLRKKMKSEKEIGEMSLASIAKAMREDDGVPIKNNQWHRSRYPDSFTGFDLVSWLVREFRDVSSRSQGTEWGVRLQEQGLIEHCRGYHNFLDGHYFYRLKGEYAIMSTPRGWFRTKHPPPEEAATPRSSLNVSKPNVDSPRRRKRLILSQSMVIDIDQPKKSNQAESVILHHDIIHNPATVFHFELQWIGTTARFIEDQVRQWNKIIEKYGLKLVEAYVTQISDVRERNAFQSCFPVRLAIPPPDTANLNIPEGTNASQYFEYALLRKFGFIVDMEAADLYPDHFDVVYSYRRSPFKYSQFVHRSGVAFVQVLNDYRGFLFLNSRDHQNPIPRILFQQAGAGEVLRGRGSGFGPWTRGAATSEYLVVL